MADNIVYTKYGMKEPPFSEDINHHSVVEYEFITFQELHTMKSPKTQQVIRSHGMKRSVRDRGRRLAQAGTNFRPVVFNQTQQTSIEYVPNPKASSVSIDEIDPFQSLPVNSSRLQTLITHNTAPQVLEPVCNVTGNSPHQEFHSMFQCGFNDPALSNAIMQALAFAANGYQITEECLIYKNNAICHINQSISNSLDFSISRIIGAILLLVGVEWRLEARVEVQIHIDGIMRLFHRCCSKPLSLNDSIKRATFWQDLFAALVTGSERALSHNSFPELYWRRDPTTPFLYTLPSGFQLLRQTLGTAMIEVIGDVHALQHLIETSHVDFSDPISVIRLDNQQASIESRLYWCVHKMDPGSRVLKSCGLALYLCTYMLFTSVWASYFIPSLVSTRLLRVLQSIDGDASGIINRGLLLWCIMVGGTFSAPGKTRSEYASLLGQSQLTALSLSWPDTEISLAHFIWPTKLFRSRAKAFWEENKAENLSQSD